MTSIEACRMIRSSRPKLFNRTTCVCMSFDQNKSDVDTKTGENYIKTVPVNQQLAPTVVFLLKIKISTLLQISFLELL